MAVHDGHRDRLREKIVSAGIESLQPHEILEFLLFAFIPRKDTNAIAHELINTFGSFADVLSTDVDRLMAVKGMTKNAAIFLNSLPDVLRVYSNDRAKEKISLAGRGVARDFMKAKLFGKEIEQVYMVAVDAKDNFIRMEKLASGDGVAVSVPVREIADFAADSSFQRFDHRQSSLRSIVFDFRYQSRVGSGRCLPIRRQRAYRFFLPELTLCKYPFGIWQ